MSPDENITARIDRIVQAFQSEQPPFLVNRRRDVFKFQGCAGVRAQNSTASSQKKTKMAYYVEGTPYEMGYLLGWMAEPTIARMCTEFNREIVFAFLDVQFKHEKILGECLETLLFWLSSNSHPDIPNEYEQELRGVLAGCRKANPITRVSWQELWVLNVGVDALLAYVYTGDLPFVPFMRPLPAQLEPKHLRIPIHCNAFSVRGPYVQDDGHFLGRDFMFPTAGVFQDTACLIIQNPRDPTGGVKQPFVSMTAPGMIGCIAGMNARGLGVGVDMSPSGNCNPSRPGLNSLLLARYSIENGKNCAQAVEIMVEAQRGVSWNYILADYESQRACVVEAGCKVDEDDLADLAGKYAARLQDPSFSMDPSFSAAPDALKQELSDKSLLADLAGADFRKGLMVRWNDYEYPTRYLERNKPLFRLFGKKYDPNAFAERGYIDRSWEDKNCPFGYYYAPQRETDPNLVLVTNMYLIPRMRLYAMHPWTNVVSASHYDDLQWRYDVLNDLLLTRLHPPSGNVTGLSVAEGKDLIDFLTPNPDKGKYPTYNNRKGQADWKSLTIEGSVSLMDLKEKTIHSHYGYYGDEWVSIRLGKYLGG